MSAFKPAYLPACRPLALAIALVLAPIASPALAQVALGELPRVGTVTSGSASISYNPAQNTSIPLTQSTTITQTTKGAIINWGSFSIGAQNTVNFNQQVAGSVTLNRVVGFAGDNPTASNILGAMNASNGSVFLVNPAGILFGSGAQVNVGGLVASTLAISDNAFNAGVTSNSFVFGTAGVVQQGNVDNEGTITVPIYGTVALLGGRVQNGDGINAASINAPQGTIALGAGSQITLDIGGDGLTQLTINVGATNGNGIYAQNNAGANLSADGGQILAQASGGTNDGVVSFASVVNNGVIQAHSLQSRAGKIVLTSGSDNGTSDQVLVQGGTLDVSGNGAGGGSVEVDGYNVGILSETTEVGSIPSVLDASGSSGGTISLNARNVAEIDNLSTLNANAVTNGNGGSIIAEGANGLYAYGSFSARGGSTSGNGGLIETSGSGLDLRGIQVSAGAANGAAGTWLIDPYDVSIVHGSAVGTLPVNPPFVPLTTSTIQDGDINDALNGGSNVTITTGTSGSTTNGNITINGGVDILRNVGTAPLTFRLDANTNISGNGPFTIQSTVGALNLVFDSDANNGSTNNGDISFNTANLLTNGGSIAMFGQDDPVNGFAQSFITGISLQQSTLDTRIAGSDANAGGTISLRGLAGYYGGGTGVSLTQTDLHSSTGNIDIFGMGTGGGSGVSLFASTQGAASLITTTSGSLAITGIGSSGSYQFGSLDGLSAVNYTLQSTTGTIDLRGYGAVNGGYVSTPAFNDGLVLDSLTTVSSGSGNIYLSGTSAGSGAGVSLVSTQGDGTILASPTIDSGSGNVVVRAHNDGTTDALVLDGTLASTGTIDLRPGGVDANGALTENPDDAIALGGATGFALSATEIGNITAHDLVLGSDIQAGAITVSAPITYTHNLTLYSGAGGGIAVNGALNLGTNTLALISAGDITQAAAVTAASLLAQSSAGLVNLDNAGNNVSSATLAGSANGDFTFVNAGTVGIGNVAATGFGAAANTPTALSGSGVSGNDVLVRALTGNMILNANVSGSNVDLVSAGIFDNAGGDTITATGDWHVWGNTWVGETRGGVAGNGTLPNLYGCTFGAPCALTLSTTANQFIYVTQPVATVNFANSTREYGLPNAAISYSINGLILGDQATNAIAGSPLTTATQASNVGSYAINGNFTSPAGYLVNVIPGALAITPATLTYIANPYSRIYGDPNGTFSGMLTGFRLTDTQASATTGTLAFTTAATQASNVGIYAIDGSGLSATNYVFVQAAGNATAFTINPATLTYVANPLQRLIGTPNGTLGGSVTGFKLDDTQASATTGTLGFQSPAGTDSPVGSYGIFGSGLNATNYVFVQANGNATALTIAPQLDTYTLDVVREMPVTYVYDSNFGIVGLCPAPDLAAGSREQEGDTLAREWSRVRSRPNLANCISSKQKNSCGDF
ncbi:MBG domain-containing protein [Rhodanobacter sp. C03]|uniref:beta strand repeat-containing protein n=1 Tax=Rhodanobacter sp. C03 TaxID=1945858 RepID=UPI0009C79862|nr:MBG domain-containing protein [Rhodanobacter sp. C03]OOG55619.1 hypothetical protein B0E48_13390 [Rhodanobacter sp. C03]